ncbi:MAG TPA: prohead protease [Gammaproteobacteria bacterium]|nr:prohead protease [Gammaproteobacteria bacterium]
MKNLETRRPAHVAEAVLAPVIEFLQRHAPFDLMAPAHLRFLAERVQLAFFAKGEAITDPAQGTSERFFIIKQGRVRGEVEPGGDHDAWELHAGECFPIGALLSRRPVRMAQRAVEDTFCFELPRDDFDKLYADSPEFRDFCSRRLASMLDRTLNTLQAAISAQVSGEAPPAASLSSLLRRTPVSCAPDTTLLDVLATMHAEHVGSMVITDAASRPLGIFTLHDLLARAAQKDFALDTVIAQVMTPSVFALAPSDTVHEATLVMARESIGHVCVVENGRLRGVVSERDLFSLQRIGLAKLSRVIAEAPDIDSLARHARDIHRLIDQMLAQGVSVAQLTQVITLLNDHVTRRAIELVLAETGLPEVPFTWLAFGSEGREEQTLKTDQDNGILFLLPKGRKTEAVRKTLLPVAKRINAALDACGYPLCTGNIMASNPECCLSLDEWKARFSHWIDHGAPEHLLKASIFFDFRTLWGEDAPVSTLRSWVTGQAADNPRFLRQMAENALRNEPPLGLVRDFVLESGGEHDNELDLKLRGITPFVDGARLLALAHGIEETNTPARLRAVATAGVLATSEAEAWCDALSFIQLLRMRNHQRQARQEETLDNFVNPDELNELDRRILKEAFRQARKLQTRLRLDYQL